MTAGLRALPTTAGTWTVSDSRTRVLFAVGNFGRVAHGTVTCGTGSVELDASGAPVRAHAELDLNTVDTGISKRDADLRKPSLLDIDRHPVMTWRCERFVATGRETYEQVERAVMRTELLPSEDPALLPGYDRIDQARVLLAELPTAVRS